MCTIVNLTLKILGSLVVAILDVQHQKNVVVEALRPQTVFCVALYTPEVYLQKHLWHPQM